MIPKEALVAVNARNPLTTIPLVSIAEVALGMKQWLLDKSAVYSLHLAPTTKPKAAHFRQTDPAFIADLIRAEFE